MRKTKLSIRIDINKLLKDAEEKNMSIINPITGGDVSGKFLVSIRDKKINGTKVDVKNYLVSNWDAFTSTGWGLVLYCTNEKEYTIGIMYTTECIECALDTATLLEENHFLGIDGHYYRVYAADFLTDVQKFVNRKRWLEDFYSFKIMNL